MFLGTGAAPAHDGRRGMDEEKLGPYRYTQNAARLTGDTLTLARFVRVRQSDRLCDLGCGAGALILLLLARDPSLRVKGVEIWAPACGDARRNMAQNGLEVPVICAHWRDFAEGNPACFDAVVANPPYFDAVREKPSPDAERRRARTGDEEQLASLCAAAGRLLVYGGRFALCYPGRRLVDLFASLRIHGLEPKRLQLEGKLACVEAKKGGKPGLEVIS